MKTVAAILTILSIAAAGQSRVVNVLTTLPDLAALAKEVGKEKVSVSSLIVGSRDPHRLEAKPSYINKAANADLFMAVGLELEVAYEQPILDGSANSKIQPGQPGHVYVGDWVTVRDVPQGGVTRAQGDMHPYGNPHVWLDPYNGRLIAAKLAERLGTIDKANAAAYKANAEDFSHRLDVAMFGSALVGKVGGATLWQWDNENKLVPNLKEKGMLDELGGWCNKMRPFWKSQIVTYHRSWNYFNYRFGLKVAAELEPKPGLDPTPGHVAAVIRTVQEDRIKLILQEPFYSTKNGEFVKSRTGATLVVAPGSVGQDPAAKDYIGLFDTIVSRVASALGK
ncbi:MAG: zinc ABC transporter substrate-binding protein [Armatimonadetes bacterium]|nr:zinc ABC transporter substrate-binding protein [Armatimonadota bacterium]